MTTKGGFQLVPKVQGVYDVSVVGESKLDVGALGNDGLSVDDVAGSGGGVTGVADADVAGEVCEVVFLESLTDQAHRSACANTLAVRAGYSGALLPSVLEGVEAEEDHAGDIFAFGIYPYHTAGLSHRVCGHVGRGFLVPLGVRIDRITLHDNCRGVGPLDPNLSK